MPSFSEAFKSALQHHRAGRLRAAGEIYQQIVQNDPAHADSWHMLGLLSAQAGDHRAAAEFLDRAVNLRPTWAEAHANLGNALRALGQSRRAVNVLQRALELKPDFAAAHTNLGNALEDLAKLDEAVECYRRVVELQPDHATAFNRLGNALVALKKPDEAVVCYRRTVELKPDSAQAHFNLGIALSQLGEHEEALACYRRALELKPHFAEAHNNVGNVFKDLGDLDAALACYRMAIEVNDGFVMAHSNAGNALRGQGKLTEAIGYYRRALELDPNFADSWNNLGNALRECGSLDDALACYRRALALKPDYVTAHSNLLDTLHYCPRISPATLAEAHDEFDRVHAAPLYGALAHDQGSRGFRDRLRLGFVSPDLGQHPVGRFLVRVLENLGRERLETICYSDRLVRDRLTDRLRAAATGWREVSGLSDDRLATQIKRDEIDILFDLAGHTARNRLLVFARKPAPIQVSWIGYEGTTGLAVMDYLIVDQWMVAQGSEHHYREKLVMMPDGYLCFDPPANAPRALPPPSLERGFATFGSFNNLAKITPEVVAVWSTLLRALPTARLVMKYRPLADRGVRERFLNLFAASGVAHDRLDLLPWTSHDDYLAAYHQVDVALDPFPFSGSTITCDSLWMGVPVITCPGETFASRHSYSHLSNIGLTETIAGDLDEYVDLAISLADDRERLIALRSGLRERMAASPLCDGKRFADHLTKIVHGLWTAHAGR